MTDLGRHRLAQRLRFVNRDLDERLRSARRFAAARHLHIERRFYSTKCYNNPCL